MFAGTLMEHQYIYLLLECYKIIQYNVICSFIYQCLITPAIIKQFVVIYDNTINVRIKAIRSASPSVSPDFSPSAFAQIRQSLVNKLIVFSATLTTCHVVVSFTNLYSGTPNSFSFFCSAVG